jgi:hypothetical protein
MLRLAISDAQFLQGVSQTAKSAFVQLSWVVSMAIRRPCTSFLSVMRRQNSLSYGRRRRVLEKAKKSFDAGETIAGVAHAVNHVVFADPFNKAPPSPYWSASGTYPTSMRALGAPLISKRTFPNDLPLSGS